MLKRFSLLIFSIAAFIFIPYVLGRILEANLYVPVMVEKEVVLLWCEGVMPLALIGGLTICLTLAHKYIRYGKLV